ncbi:MAG: SRPBCC domain-containing protein [Armatimonadota bacterium]
MTQHDEQQKPQSVTLTGSVRRRLYVGVPAEELWPWLVEPELTERYHLAPLLLPLQAVGDPVQYVSKLGGTPVVEGTVQELVPGRRLVHSFAYAAAENALLEPDPPSRVELELVRCGDRMCCLELTHSRFHPASSAYNALEASWDVILSSLKTWVETGGPLPWPSRGR